MLYMIIMNHFYWIQQADNSFGVVYCSRSDEKNHFVRLVLSICFCFLFFVIYITAKNEAYNYCIQRILVSVDVII